MKPVVDLLNQSPEFSTLGARQVGLFTFLVDDSQRDCSDIREVSIALAERHVFPYPI